MKLFNYLSRHVLFIIFLVLLLIVAVDFAFAVIGEIKMVGHNGYTLKDAFFYVLLRLPSDIYIIFPIACFLGSLIGLLILSTRSELIVMRAAGVSIVQLAKALLYSTGVLLAIYYTLSLFLAPYTRHLATLQNNLGSNQNVLVLAEQTWLKSGDHFILLGAILPDNTIQNVSDFQIQNSQLTHIRQIENIHLNNDNTWTLNHITTTSLNSEGVTQSTTDTLTEPSLIADNLLSALTMQPDEMNIITLYHYIKYRKTNKLDTKSYELQFWNRLFTPWMIPIMVLIAIPFALGSPRAHMHWRLISGLSLGFSVYLVSQFFGSFTLLSPIPAALGALLPPLIFGGLLLFLLLFLS